MAQQDSPALQLARTARATAAARDTGARTAAVAAIIETIGTMLAGSCETASAKLVRALMPADGPSSLLGGKRCVAALDAAFVNAAAAYGLSSDASSRTGAAESHAAPLVAALLALGEARQETGAKLVDALHGGFSLARSLKVTEGAKSHRRLSCPAQAAALATACGCALMLDLDETRMAEALALAVSLQADARLSGEGATLVALHFGSAARNGLLAALLAAEGFDCDAQLPEGLAGHFSDGSAIGEASPRNSADQLFNDFEVQAARALPGENIAILFERLETIESATNLALIGRMLRTADAVRAPDSFSRIDITSDQTAIETQWVP